MYFRSMEITKITEQDDKTLISGIEEKPKTMVCPFTIICYPFLILTFVNLT
jgi:hypothetical protein